MSTEVPRFSGIQPKTWCCCRNPYPVPHPDSVCYVGSINKNCPIQRVPPQSQRTIGVEYAPHQHPMLYINRFPHHVLQNSIAAWCFRGIEWHRQSTCTAHCCCGTGCSTDPQPTASHIFSYKPLLRSCCFSMISDVFTAFPYAHAIP